MAVDIRRRLDPWVDREPIRAELKEDEALVVGQMTAMELMEKVSEILQYDIFEASLMAEGYREQADEMLSISESTISASIETLPPE